MKKAKIWISACVHILLYSTLVTCSVDFGDIITDDVNNIPLLKQEIPNDYKIPVRYIPKEVGGMCWVELNVFHLEMSLKALAQKFGNVSSNRDNITIFVQMLQNVRFGLSSLESIMKDFECHYREETWQTGRYFDYVQDILITTRSIAKHEECEPPSCLSPATPPHKTESPTGSTKGSVCIWSETDCTSRPTHRVGPEVLEKRLLYLLIIPAAAVIFLLFWKVKSKRRSNPPDMHIENADLFTRPEGDTLPVEGERIEEKSRLSVIEDV